MKKIILLIFMLILFVTSIIFAKNTNSVVEETISTNEINNLVVYFPRLPDIKFVAEKIKVEGKINDEEKVKLIINRLIKGTDKANLLDVIPQGSILNNVYIKGNTAFVDFSKEFVNNHPGGSLGEYNTIYSIVNSLTEIKVIEQVVFLIDGKKQSVYKGHTQFDMPIKRDESMIVVDNF